MAESERTAVSGTVNIISRNFRDRGLLTVSDLFANLAREQSEIYLKTD